MQIIKKFEREAEKGCVFFKEIELYGKSITECEIALSGRDYRMYYAPNSTAFDAVLVRFVCANSYSKDIWECEELQVEVVFSCTAYWDGVRHLHFNAKDDGYIYYPDMPFLLKSLNKLRELEEQYCREPSGEQNETN